MPKKSKRKGKKLTGKALASARKNIKKAQRALARKSNKPRRSSTRSVAKKKGSSRRPGKKSFIDRIPVLRNKTVQKVGFGLGMGVIVSDLIGLAQRFAPNQTKILSDNEPLIRLATELATEPLSAVVDVALNPGQLSKITGGRVGGNSMNGMQQQAGGNTVGFA